MSSPLNSKIFSECLHTTFELVHPNGERTPLQLASVTEMNYSARLEQFSLIFHGPLTPVCEQRIYRLLHPTLGELNMFLVPVGPEQQWMRYEVVVNRVRRDPAAQA
jgi:hypothetical protein